LVCAGLVLVLVLSLFGGALAAPAPETGRYLIGFRGLPDSALVRAFGGEVTHEYSIIPAVAARLPASAAAALARNPKIAYVEVDGVAHALETLPWGIERVQADKVWNGSDDVNTAGAGVKVAILDTGIGPHLDLEVTGGFSFVDGEFTYDDHHGHGTHVAGTVAALDNTIAVIGCAPAVDLYAVKVLSASGSGYFSWIIAGIDWAVKEKMDVINMSLGASSGSTALEAACDAAYQEGVLIVAAAGNSGTPPGRGDNVGYPARYDSVIAVAATTDSDARASFSSTGPAVELAAPGSRILSTTIGDGTGLMSGTSMASPHVAGVAALVMWVNSDRSNVQIRQALADTAKDLGTAGRDIQYGHGLVQALAAVSYWGDTGGGDDGGGGGDDGGGDTGITLLVDVKTDKSVYSSGEQVAISVTVSDGAAEVSGATTRIEITTASGKRYSSEGTTGADGVARFSFKIKRPDGFGDYTVNATATKSGYEAGNGSIGFKVQ